MSNLMRDSDNERDDLALVTLQTVAREADERLPPDLVEKLYDLQKKHQFDADRGVSVQEMQRLLEQYIDTLVGDRSR